MHCDAEAGTVVLKNPTNAEVSGVGGITVHEKFHSHQEPERTFSFDAVFGIDSDQMRVYNVAARPIVENVLKGYNGKFVRDTVAFMIFRMRPTSQARSSPTARRARARRTR